MSSVFKRSFCAGIVWFFIVSGVRVTWGSPSAFEWHTENFNSIHANKLVSSISTDNDTISLAPFTCVRNKDSCNDQQCCFGQQACCKSTGVCGCRDPGDNPLFCPYDIATTSISSSASSSDKSVVTNACIQTISQNPKAASSYSSGGGRGRGARYLKTHQPTRSTRNIAGQQPVVSYAITPEGDLNGFIRTAATGNTYVLTTTTTANFGPVSRFLAMLSADELMEYLQEDVIEDLLMLNGCRRWQIFRR